VPKSSGTTKVRAIRRAPSSLTAGSGRAKATSSRIIPMLPMGMVHVTENTGPQFPLASLMKYLNSYRPSPRYST